MMYRWKLATNIIGSYTIIERLLLSVRGIEEIMIMNGKEVCVGLSNWYYGNHGCLQNMQSNSQILMLI